MLNRLRWDASEEIHLPPDIVAGAMLITLQDNQRIQIENLYFQFVYLIIVNYDPLPRRQKLYLILKN